MPRAEVLQLADGRIFTGRQAKAVGLVDKLGGFEPALRRAAKLGGIRGKIRRIEYGPHNFFEAFFGPSDVDSQMRLLARRVLLDAASKELSQSLLR
jgi:ClpP class serine protease